VAAYAGTHVLAVRRGAAGQPGDLRLPRLGGRAARRRCIRVLALIWDNASWHISQEVRAWLRQHNRAVKATGRGCRLLVCRLPSRSPWLNAIEPKWVHGKRAVVEPTRKLSGAELQQRLCAYYRTPLLQPLAQQLA
jgi:hypothetical protein